PQAGTGSRPTRTIALLRRSPDRGGTPDTDGILPIWPWSSFLLGRSYRTRAARRRVGRPVVAGSSRWDGSRPTEAEGRILAGRHAHVSAEHAWVRPLRPTHLRSRQARTTVGAGGL